jgi:hypothetical protein
MPRSITPLDDNLQLPETIPDKSEVLSNVYIHNKKGKTGQNSSTKPDKMPYFREMRYVDAIVIQSFLIFPYIISFLSITTIYSLGGSTNTIEALGDRIATILLTLTALLPWVFSISRLRSYLFIRRLNVSTLIVAYFFFIMPIIDLSTALLNKGMNNAVILLATFLLSQIYLLTVIFAAKSPRLVSIKLALPVFIVLLLAAFAAIV